MSRTMTMSEAINEARRCLNCARPTCRTGCPIANNIPQFIRALSEGNIGLAYETIAERSNLPAICGRVCPHERQCEAHCVLTKNKHGIEIGSLEMFIADFAHENNLKPLPPSTGKRGKVAVIGSGPAGLTVAGDLAKMNFAVTILEGQSEPGGILLFGIPEFRLQKDVVRREITELLHLGVEIKTNMLVGPDFTVDDLFEQGYDAVFMGTGTSLPRTLDIPGKELSGILTATYFLRMVVLSDSGKLDESETLLHDGDNVVVIGAGNVAMDAARCAKRLGAEVYVVYRRGMEELPARKEEVEHAEEEGIIFKTLCNPVEIHPDENGFVKSITCVEMELGEPDASGRRRPIEKKGSEFELDVDTVIMSLGTSPNPLIRSTTPGLETNKHGCIVTDGDDGKTSRDGVYAGGDAVTGAATVIKAMGAGKAAAKAIHEYIQNK